MKPLHTATILFFTCISMGASAQTQNCQWAQSTGGTSFSNAVSTDPAGNVFVVGSFEGATIAFGVTTLTNSETPASNLFLVKYDSSGHVQWAKSAKGDGVNAGGAPSVAVDAFGNAYVAGVFSDSITFGAITLYGSPSISSHFFLVKYDGSGHVLWAKGADGTGVNGGGALSVTADALGHAYITGFFLSNTMVIGLDTLFSSGGQERMFIAKYDANGNAVWAKSAGTITQNSQANAVTTDEAGNVCVTGVFRGDTLTLGSIILTNMGNGNIFIVKYDSSGNVLWARSAGGITRCSGLGITTNSNGDVFTTGEFSNAAITFGNITLPIFSGTTGSAFIVKYDALGNVLWAKSTGAINEIVYGYSVKADATGNVYMAGAYTGATITFGATTLVDTSGCNCENLYLVKYDSSGNVLWAKGGSNFYVNSVNAVTTDTFGNCIIAGYFNAGSSLIDTLYLGSIPLGASMNNIIGIAPVNMFVAKFGNCILPTTPANTTTPAAPEICADGSTILFASGTGTLGWYSADTGGTYLGGGADFFTPALAVTTTYYVQDSTCGSSGRTAITVRIFPKATPVISLSNNDTLTTGIFSTYQWLLNGTAINTATEQTNIATANGNYQVAVTDSNGCTDTSGIYHLSTLGIAVLNQLDKISVFPNPSTGEFVFSGVKNGYSIEIYNVLGELIYTSIANKDAYQLDLAKSAKGVYFYKITGNNNSTYQGKIIVE